MPDFSVNIGFKPVVGNYVDPANLETVTAAYNTLEQGHQTAVAQASAVKTELAKLDLNEAEDAWRQEQINRIESELNDNMRYGNAYSSLDDVIRSGGKIMSSPGMIGRLRAQKDYKTYLDNLNARTDLSEDYKNYYRTVNQYKYKDVVDANGNIIGGTKWEPTDKEVSEVPLNTILTNALKWAAKDAGGFTNTRWLDINGNPTNDPSKSVTGEYYDSVKGQWESLSKEKLAAAVRASIETTPGAKASLEQDYKIAKWKYDQNGGVNPDITDKGGYLLSPEEYLNKRIDPFYKAATYYNQTTEVEYGEALKAQIAYNQKKAAGASNDDFNNRVADALSFTTNPITIENTAPIEEQGKLNMANQALANLFLKNNPKANVNLEGMTDEQIEAAIASLSNPEDKVEAMFQLQQRQEAQDYLEYVSGGMSNDDKKKFDAYVAINSGTQLNQGTNQYYDDYVNSINTIWDNNNFIRQYFADEEGVDRFMDAIGGYDKARSLGITSGVKDGKKYVQIGAENKKYTGLFGSAARTAVNRVNGGVQFWRGLAGAFNPSYGDNTVLVDSEGNENNFRGAVLSTQGDVNFKPIDDFLNGLHNDYTSAMNNLGNITLGQQGIRAATPDVAEAMFNLKVDPSTENQRLFSLSEDEAIDALSSIDLVQQGAYEVSGDTNNFEMIDSERRMEIQGALRNGTAKISNPNMVFDARTYQWSPMMNVTYKDKDGNQQVISLYIPGGINSSIARRWNHDTGFRAKTDVNVYFGQERDLGVTNGRSFAGLDVFYIRHRNGITELINKTNGQSYGQISTDDAVNLRDISHQWNDTYQAVRLGIVAPNIPQVTNLATNVATQLAGMYGSTDANTISYIYSKLMENLVR